MCSGTLLSHSSYSLIIHRLWVWEVVLFSLKYTMAFQMYQPPKEAGKSPVSDQTNPKLRVVIHQLVWEKNSLSVAQRNSPRRCRNFKALPLLKRGGGSRIHLGRKVCVNSLCIFVSNRDGNCLIPLRTGWLHVLILANW